MKTEEIKVSVIVPVYNASGYLPRCIESICAQTLKEIEILLIDDGSSDDSFLIIEEYAKKDKRIRAFRHENRGAGAERNFGTEMSGGKYLSFLDADDHFEPDMLREAYEACESKQADFCVFKADLFDSKTGKRQIVDWILREDLVPRKDVFSYKDIEQNIFRIFNGWAWDKLYSRDFVLREGLKFQEQRTTNDLFFVYAALVKARRITVVYKTFAHHRTEIGESLSNTREKSWDCFYHALMLLKAELESMNIYGETKRSFVNYALHFTLWNLDTITGPAFIKLYNALREKLFHDMEIDTEPAEFFYTPDEYKRYEFIRDHEPEEYLLQKYEEYRRDAGEIAKRLGHGSIYEIDEISYKAGRRLTWLARKTKAFSRQLKRGGFKSAVSMTKDRLTQRKRG